MSLSRSLMAAARRNYESAVNGLNSCQTSAAILEEIRKSGNLLNQQSIPEMREYLRRIGYSAADLNRLNMIHIAGTKGKGSTSAFCDSILRQCSIVENGVRRPVKTGFRERIRINGAPISRDDFSKHFYHVWDSFEKPAVAPSEETTIAPPPSAYVTRKGNDKPNYFRFLYLMACRAFLEENVDVAIMEVGVGGEYDATNAVEKPWVTAIHEIAWHKAGIMKEGVPAFTADQPEGALRVIRERAAQRRVAPSFQLASPSSLVYELTEDEEKTLHHIQLGLHGSHQYKNAAVAVRACREWLHTYSQRTPYKAEATEEELTAGLEKASWPGRAQTFVSEEHPQVTWLLDGAHTPESLLVCSNWFTDVYARESTSPSNSTTKNALFFNCTGGRDPKELLLPLSEARLGIRFDRVFFCTNDVISVKNADSTNFTVRKDESLTLQNSNRRKWEDLLQPGEACEVHPSIDSAVASLDAWLGGFLTYLKADVV
ncbi:Mur ligase [Zopfochytrium polystomum]|nr:Mur ligase [Zopfochytrium polystomum]